MTLEKIIKIIIDKTIQNVKISYRYIDQPTEKKLSSLNAN